ncbi:MAG: hypothetical protein D6677_13075 [Calditrichaeota bacterium]|nr:MAG: hypothetical protein D6677_13075 [Calditrichota bacterium]
MLTLGGLVAGGPDGWVMLSVNLVYAHLIGTFIGLPAYRITRKYKERGKVMVFTLALAVVVGAAAGTELSYLLVKTVLFPEYVFPWSHEQLFQAGFTISLLFGLGGVIYFRLESRARRMVATIHKQEMARERLMMLNKSAELEALRARINPHFLFNTINSVLTLIPTNPEKAEWMLEKLAALFRGILIYKENDRVPLHRELTWVRDYLEIEKIRLGDRLHYTIDADETTGKFTVPEFLLQPLVENAVIHGIAPKQDGGRITVSARQASDRLILEVRDNGVGFSSAIRGTGHGMKLVKERLKLLYGEYYRFEVFEREGVTVRLELPVANEREPS